MRRRGTNTDDCGADPDRQRPRSSGSSAGAPRRSSGPATTPTAAVLAARPRHRSPPGDRADRARLPGRDRAPDPALGRPATAAADRAARAESAAVSASLLDLPRRTAASSTSARCTIHLYGLTLLVAILALRLADGRALAARWAATPTSSCASPSGASRSASIGARAYHDITSWSEVPDPKWKGVFEVWKGGLGVWGGILLGTLAGVDRRAPRRARRVAPFMDAAAPGPAARAGHRPDRQLVEPGALRQADDAAVGPEDRRRAPARCSTSTRTTFHPTFLYELIWDVVGVAAADLGRPALADPAAGALRALRRLLLLRPLLRGAAAHRPAHHFAGLRLNAWVSIVVFVCSTAFFVCWQVQRRRRDRRRRAARRKAKPRADPAGAEDGRPEGARPVARLASAPWRRPRRRARARPRRVRGAVRPAALARPARRAAARARSTSPRSCIAFVERLAERDELDLDACGEFLVLISALLELKARGLFPDEEAELAELEPEEAAEELARRLAEYRRAKEARGVARRAARTSRATASSGSARRRSRRRGRSRAFASQEPEKLAAALRLLAVEPPRAVDRAHGAALPAGRRSSSSAGARCCAAARRFDFDQEVAGLSRVEVAVAFLALLELRKQDEIALAQAAPFAPIRISRAADAKGVSRGTPAPPDRDRTRSTSSPARSRRCSSSRRSRSPCEELADGGRRRRASASRRRSSCSASASARAAAGSCSSTSPAAGPSAPRATRPRRARGCSSGPSSAASRRRRSRRSRSSPTSARARARRSRGSAASTSTASSRGWSSAGCSPRRAASGEFGAVRYRTTPLFERVFGLESLAALPRARRPRRRRDRDPRAARSRSPRSARPRPL